MAKIYTKNTWVDEVLSGAERYDIKDNGGSPIHANVSVDLITSVATAGTDVDASHMNNIENGVDGLDNALVAGNAVNIHALTGKTTPVDNDEVNLIDSAASFVAKKLTWENIKATLKTYFDALYMAIVSPGTAANVLRSNGSVWASAALVATDISDITYGTYTATLTGGTNVAAISNLQLFMYIKIGNTIMVTGNLYVDPTSSGAMDFGMSIPIASNFTAVGHCNGTACSLLGEAGAIQADVANDRAQVKTNVTSSANNMWLVNFMYRIL